MSSPVLTSTRRTSLIVPLDVDSLDAASETIAACGPVPVFKVGFQLFTRCGPAAVELVRRAKKEVFLDLKLHDIPNTVEQGANAAADLGAALTTVHAVGGPGMIEAARRAVEGSQTKVLAVTVLTSMNDAVWRQVTFGSESTADAVVRLAKMAFEAGAHGIVASPQEAHAIREALGPAAIIVTPGVRPSWAGKDDQARVASPADAHKAGADYVVCGRPILNHANPAEAARLVLEELGA